MDTDVAGLAGGLFRRLLDAIYPPACLLCAAPGTDGMDICAACRNRLPWLGPACSQCAIPLPAHSGDGPRCGQCLQQPPAFDASLSLFRYERDAVKLIHALKFNQKLACSRLLGTLLADAVARQADALPDCILPVPLHRRRLRERGYNQSIELARPVASAFGIPIDVRSVERVRNTDAQARLDRKRRRNNMRGAFQLAGPLSVRHVAIVDDVVTTMCTVNELARVVKQVGVERVDVWSIARAV